MRIAVVGAGGVGGYFGARLTRAGLPVTFVARGAHLAAIRERGLTLRSTVHGDLMVAAPATDDPATIGEVDLVLFCVKSNDTEVAAQQIEPIVGPQTMIVSLQNGVDNEARIEAALGAGGRGRVLGGVAYIAASLGIPGEVIHTGEGRLTVGELAGGVSERVRRLARVCADAGIPCQVASNITWVLWRKLLWNSAFNALTTIGRVTVRQLLEVPEAVTTATAAMQEVTAVARARHRAWRQRRRRRDRLQLDARRREDLDAPGPRAGQAPRAGGAERRRRPLWARGRRADARPGDPLCGPDPPRSRRLARPRVTWGVTS